MNIKHYDIILNTLEKLGGRRERERERENEINQCIMQI